MNNTRIKLLNILQNNEEIINNFNNRMIKKLLNKL